MPKLLFMVACEHVIISSEDNTTSLINIIEGIGIEISQELPQNAELPQRWGIFSSWRREEIKGEQSFTQRMEMVSPSGKIAKENETPFKFAEGKFNHRVKLNINGLPIGEAGIWSINLFIKEASADAQWSLKGSLPFHIEHTRQQSEEPTTEAPEA